VLDECVADVFYVPFTDELSVQEQYKDKRHFDHSQQSKDSQRQKSLGSKRLQQQRKQKLAERGMCVQFACLCACISPCAKLNVLQLG